MLVLFRTRDARPGSLKILATMLVVAWFLFSSKMPYKNLAINLIMSLYSSQRQRLPLESNLHRDDLRQLTSPLIVSIWPRSPTVLALASSWTIRAIAWRLRNSSLKTYRSRDIASPSTRRLISSRPHLPIQSRRSSMSCLAVINLFHR